MASELLGKIDDRYNSAKSLIEKGSFDEAISILEGIRAYKDSIDLLAEAKKGSQYDEAVQLMETGNYKDAYTILEELGKHDLINSNKYERALALISTKDYEEAVALLSSLGEYKNSVQLVDECYIQCCGEYLYEQIKNASIGDTITFGSYEQDNNLSNGTEVIEWVVLEKEGTKVFVISKEILLAVPFDSVRKGEYEWLTCSLRKLLNNSFLDDAFSLEERSYIEKTIITYLPDENPTVGKEALDYCYLLSFEEYLNYTAIKRMNLAATPTPYAIATLSGREDFENDHNDATSWWLRDSDGKNWGWARLVKADGGYTNGRKYIGHGVRPSMWINLSLALSNDEGN